MPPLAPEHLLAEVEDVIRTMPPRATIRHDTDENHSWLGRASAVIRQWDEVQAIIFAGHVSNVHNSNAHVSGLAFRNLLTMLHLARSELRLQAVGPMSMAIGSGGVFDYFDEVRKIVEMAKSDLLFVDPYLDAEFVSRYLTHVATGVSTRLLGRERMTTLLPAVGTLRQQSGLSIEVRSASGFHDRYVFVDNQLCYQSGASFKDGAKKAPTTLTQIVDAFSGVYSTYEQLWASGTPCP